MPDWSRPDPRTGFDYVGDPKPSDTVTGETWFDTGTGNAFVFIDDSGTTEQIDVANHAELGGIGSADHHARPTESEMSDAAPVQGVGSALSLDASDVVQLVLSGVLTVDGSGQLDVADGSLTQSHLSFATATEAELDTHAGRSDNPHNVTDSQTGAASALSSHASNNAAHHARYSDAEASAAAPIQPGDSASRSASGRSWVQNGSVSLGSYGNQTLSVTAPDPAVSDQIRIREDGKATPGQVTVTDSNGKTRVSTDPSGSGPHVLEFRQCAVSEITVDAQGNAGGGSLFVDVGQLPIPAHSHTVQQ